jgi:hypothetical protein
MELTFVTTGIIPYDELPNSLSHSIGILNFNSYPSSKKIVPYFVNIECIFLAGNGEGVTATLFQPAMLWSEPLIVFARKPAMT